MGNGLRIKCGCGEVDEFLGVGSAYPTLYKEKVKDIRAGKYGEEMKRLFMETELATVDAGSELYLCTECGYVGSAPCLDLYRPKDLKVARAAKVGWDGDTVGDFGYWPLWLTYDPENGVNGNYTLLKEFEHFCPKCGYVMKKTNAEEIERYTCPTCKQKYTTAPGALYD